MVLDQSANWSPSQAGRPGFLAASARSGAQSVRRLAGWLVAASMLLAAPALAMESRLDTILKRDKLIVSVMSTSAPNGFIDEKGELTGFEVEFARLIAKAMLGDPNKVEFMVTSVDGRFPSVLSGKADMGLSSVTRYPDRAVRLAFTTPYMDSGTAVVVRRDAGIKSLEDLNDPRVTLVAGNSTAMVDRAKRYAPQAKALFFDGDTAAALALKSGRANAYQADLAMAKWTVAQNPDDFELLPGLLGNINGNSVFMKPGDFPLWLAVDTIVQEYVSGSRYDEYRELYRKWYGSEPPAQRFYTVK